MKIFIAEDEKPLAEALKLKFESEKYEVRVAHDGETALVEIKSFNPDIILLDILMPKKTGYEVLQELKADNNFKHIPVIMLSNLDSDEDIKRSFSLGAVDYFVKSNHPLKEVIEKINEHALRAK